MRRALVDVRLAVVAGQSRRTQAMKSIDPVSAVTAVFAGDVAAIVDVKLAAISLETGRTVTRRRLVGSRYNARASVETRYRRALKKSWLA